MSAVLPPITTRVSGSSATGTPVDSRNASLVSSGHYQPGKPPTPPPRQRRPATTTSTTPSLRPPATTQAGRYLRRPAFDDELEAPSLGSRVYLSKKQEELLAVGHESPEETASRFATKQRRRHNPNVTSVQRLFQLAGRSGPRASGDNATDEDGGEAAVEKEEAAAAVAARRISLSSSFLSEVFSVDDFHQVRAPPPLRHSVVAAAPGADDLWEVAVEEKKNIWTEALYYLSLLHQERELYAREKAERLQLLGQFISCRYPEPCRCLRWDMEVLEDSVIPLEPAIHLPCLFVSLVLSECVSSLHRALLQQFLKERQVLFETFKLEAITFGVRQRLQDDEEGHWRRLLDYHQYAMTRAALQGDPYALQWQQRREEAQHERQQCGEAVAADAAPRAAPDEEAKETAHASAASAPPISSALVVVPTAKTGALIIPPADFVAVHRKAARAYVGDYDSPFCTQLTYLDYRILTEAEELRRQQIVAEEAKQAARYGWYYHHYSVVANLLLQWELSRHHVATEEQKEYLHLADAAYAARVATKTVQKDREDREELQSQQNKELFQFLLCVLHAKEQYSEMYLQELQAIHAHTNVALHQVQLQQHMVDLSDREEKARAVLERAEREEQAKLQLVTGWAATEWLPALQRLYCEQTVAWVVLTRIVLAEDWERAQVEEMWAREHGVLFASREDSIKGNDAPVINADGGLPLRNLVMSDLYTFMDDKNLISLFS